MKSHSLAALLLLPLAVSTAYAQDGETSSVRVSGFGTGALTWTNTNDAQFARTNQASGAGTSPRTGVDSNLGVQVDAKINDWLSLTGQGLVRKFGEDDYGADATLAFAKFKFSDTLNVRVGRVPLAIFMVSDYRNVGYANTMVRPSQEVYSQVPMDSLDGADLSWQQNIGSSTLTTQLAYGSSTTTMAGGVGKAKLTDASVVNFIFEQGPYTLRFGRNDGKLSLDQGAFHLPKTKVSFTGIGFSMDSNNVVVQSEYTQARGIGNGSNGWYVMGGYRFDKVLPYYSHGKETRDIAQSTDSVGLRWDAFRSAALKFQVDRVDPTGRGLFIQPKTGFHGPVTVGTIAVDFVF
ncbi:hypothetical protein NX786_00770 [Telluria mixta]|uniref:Porin n=1 Tax=Telluria mixta TaxID=34071 RepID=A0ABT2BRY4_9BURK|nr:hypothetical protein [Telluria mixta]MCS0627879.1 hypothetical protein [Telluria mixta]WEM94002.1 hypothetical protein P0M04_21220 [Telluria mixta]